MTKFSEDPSVGVLTTAVVLSGAPILAVSHDADDGGWQFLCGTTVDPAQGRVVHLSATVQLDEGVERVADLPLGWVAHRASPSDPWIRERAE
jgi:hypothetical protein